MWGEKTEQKPRLAACQCVNWVISVARPEENASAGSAHCPPGGNMIGSIIAGAVGILFIWLGELIRKKERIDLFHAYHTEKVSPENQKSILNQNEQIIGRCFDRRKKIC